jgi:hypothetical protein
MCHWRWKWVPGAGSYMGVRFDRQGLWSMGRWGLDLLSSDCNRDVKACTGQDAVWS